jgi:galactokinase
VGRRNANSVLQLANTNPKYGQKMVALKKDTPVEVDKYVSQMGILFSMVQNSCLFCCFFLDLFLRRSNHHWSNYFLCGYKAVVDITKPEIPLGLAFFKNQSVIFTDSLKFFRCFAGMDVCLDGTVPAGAGLSSSSALVCCAALATITAQTNDLQRTFVFFNVQFECCL